MECGSTSLGRGRALAKDAVLRRKKRKAKGKWSVRDGEIGTGKSLLERQVKLNEGTTEKGKAANERIDRNRGRDDEGSSRLKNEAKCVSRAHS